MRVTRNFFWWNFPILAIAGLVMSFWAFHFTDAFDAIGGALGAGGILVWLSFVWTLLPSSRRARLKRRCSLHIFQGQYSGPVLAVATGVFLLVVSFRGTVQFSMVEGIGPVRVMLTSNGGNGRTTTHIMMGGERKRVCRWVGFGEDAVFVIRIDGYPSERVKIRSWLRTDRIVPYSYLRPILLLRANEDRIVIADEKKLHWQITIGDNEPIEKEFDGRSLWIGCDSSMVVPSRLLVEWEDRWAKTNETEDRKRKLRKALKNPDVLYDTIPMLEPGTVVRVSLKETAELDSPADDNSREFTLPPISSYDDVVQEIVVVR